MRRVVTALAIALCLGAGVDNAAACSCVAQKPLEKLKAVKAAFIGTVVEKTLVEGDGRPFDSTYRYRIRVRRDFKRKLGEHIALQASSDDASCGFEWDLRERVAAYLYGKPGRWSTSLCLLERPGRLRRAAKKAGLSLRLPMRSPLSTCR